MTFNEIVEKVRAKAEVTDASDVDFLAVQVNLTGDDGGVFYIEVKNGNKSVMPYEYIDRSCAVTMSPEDFLKLMDGKLDPVAAFTKGKLKVEGDLGKALEFAKIVK